MSELPLHFPTVSLLVSNMHCPSCSEAITQLLSSLPSIRNLSVSLLLRTVTFAIDLSISSSKVTVTTGSVINDVTKVLVREGGFEVEPSSTSVEIRTAPHKVAKKGLLHRLSSALFRSREERKPEERRLRHLDHCMACQEEEEKTQERSQLPSLEASSLADGIITTILSIEGMTCASCTGSISSALEAHPSVLKVDINLLSSSGLIVHRSNLPPLELVQVVEDVGFAAEVMSSDDKPTSGPTLRLKSTFAIEGMTCASCSSAIHRALSEVVGIEDIAIDVLGHKGAITHTSAIPVKQIEESIEDLGYGAVFIASKAVVNTKQVEGTDKSRTVSIRIQGVFCGKCITKINAHLASLPSIEYSPVTLQHPITKITYVPHKPHTARSIIEGLSSLAPEFDAEVVRAQSLSERSLQIQEREMRTLVLHLAVAVLFAIPTFVMYVLFQRSLLTPNSAIVGMVLVNGNSELRQWCMTDDWGAANRGTLILWPLATVVQFGVGR